MRVLEYDRIREVLASYAASPLGKVLAGRMRPLKERDLIRRQHVETEEMRALLKVTRLPLAGSADIAGELEDMARHGRPAEPDQLYRVLELLRVSRSVHALLTGNSATPQLSAVLGDLEDLPDLRERIPEAISVREGVRDEASSKLAELRARIRQLRQTLRERAHRILSDSGKRNAFQGGGVAIKNDRYLLPVKGEYRSWVPGPIRDRSHSGATLYIEPEALTLQGDELLDRVDGERDEVLRILWELTRAVLAQRDTIRRIQDKVAWIDFTYAKACYADAFALETPHIEERKVLELRDARHPYLMWLSRDTARDHRDVDIEAIQERVVPLSARFGERYRVVVVTGPNTGGKTVALKTIGLNVLLALSGVPIAASNSRVPVYDDVFADIGDEQSIEQSLSTFSSHLTHIIEILRLASERSLVLLDELGAGTDPLEGAALGQALLDKALERGWHTMITTHIGSLKRYAFARDGVENAAMEFDDESLRPTYRLLMGVPGSSMALAVARRMGLDEDVLVAAEAEVARADEPTREVIEGMEKSRRRIERERQKVERARRRARGEVRELEELKAALRAERDALGREMEKTLDETMRAAKSRLEPVLERLRNVPKSHRETVEKLESAIEKIMVATPLGERREQFARSLKKGDEVFVPKFRENATVRKIDKGGRKLTLLLGGISVEIGFDDVSWLDGPDATGDNGS